MLVLPPPDPAIEIVLASRGMSKGLAQTDGPQLLVRTEVAVGAVTLGAYGKNVTSPTAEGEAGGTVAIKKTVATFLLSGGVGWKHAVGAARGSDADAVELTGSVSRVIGPVTPRLSIAWSPDDLGSTLRSRFVEAGASYRIAKGWALSGAVGGRKRGGVPNYRSYNVGIAWTPVAPLTIDLRYYDTDGGGDAPYRGRAVASARARF